ncbi:MAG: hypothetical protein KDD61_10245 [Bdellovibrionales bacterium]|nr:hypothetical protein [Bdellovibrionales bacterium]
MEYILIVEPEVSVVRTLQSTLESLQDPKKLKAFSSGTDMLNWLTKKIAEKKRLGDKMQMDVRLIILDSHMVAEGKAHLLEPIQKRLVAENLTHPEKPCGYVVTFYESEDFNIRHYIHPLIYNVIFKPFDALLLKESLKAALNGRVPVQPEVYVHDAKGQVEILKDIKTTAITELGFRTQSAREIPFGKKARYYCEHFRGSGKEYVYAFCYANRTDPKSPKHFLSSFAYFGISKDQLRAIRRFIHSRPTHHEMPIQNEYKEDHQECIVVLTQETETLQAIQAISKERFKKLKVIHLPSLSELNIALNRTSPNPKTNASSIKELRLRIHPKSHLLLQIIVDGKPLSDTESFLGHSVATLTSGKQTLSYLLNAKYDRQLSLFLQAPKKAATPVTAFKSSENVLEYFKVEDYDDTTMDQMAETDKELPEDCKDLILVPLNSEELKTHLGIQDTQLSHIEAIFVELPDYVSDSYLLSLKHLSEEIHMQRSGTALLALARNQITTYESLERFKFFDDYIVHPIDSFYFSHKLKQLFPHIENKEGEISREGIEEVTTIQTALPVRVQKISELHISILHNRPLKLGDVRRFVLFSSDSEELPAVWGACNHVQPSGTDEYLHEFIYFGVNDHHLRFIRKWMKQQYIHSKAQ